MRFTSPHRLRPQVFSTSRRFDPPRACWPCFMPDPLMGFCPSELCSPRRAVRRLRRRSPLAVERTRRPNPSTPHRRNGSKRPDHRPVGLRPKPKPWGDGHATLLSPTSAETPGSQSIARSPARPAVETTCLTDGHPRPRGAAETASRRDGVPRYAFVSPPKRRPSRTPPDDPDRLGRSLAVPNAPKSAARVAAAPKRRSHRTGIVRRTAPAETDSLRQVPHALHPRAETRRPPRATTRSSRATPKRVAARSSNPRFLRAAEAARRLREPIGPRERPRLQGFVPCEDPHSCHRLLGRTTGA
jgi:hypothetical protein